HPCSGSVCTRRSVGCAAVFMERVYAVESDGRRYARLSVFTRCGDSVCHCRRSRLATASTVVTTRGTDAALRHLLGQHGPALELTGDLATEKYHMLAGAHELTRFCPVDGKREF